MKLFVRFGDNAGYQEVDDIAHLTEQMQEIGISGPFLRTFGGITAPGYEGKNYISLYWGNDVETPLRSIDDWELNYINEKE